jgi:hypothetical protein
LEEHVVNKSNPFGDDLKKIAREDLGLFVLDESGKKITLNDPNFLLQVPKEKPAPFKFSFTAKNFTFITDDELNNSQFKVVGKVYLCVSYYSQNSGKKEEHSLRKYLFNRVVKN